jgi:hypothetical protein
MSQKPPTLTIALETHFRPLLGEYRLDEFRDHGPMLIPSFSEDAKHRDKLDKEERDPWEVRAVLLDSREDATDFKAFTRDYGQFGPYSSGDLQFERRQLGPLHLARNKLSGRLQFASSVGIEGPEGAAQALEADFQEWRDLLRAAMKSKIANWPSLAKRFPLRKVSLLTEPFPFRIQWRNAVPVGVADVRTAVQAVITSIQIDMLRGARFRYCARKNCGRVFEVKSRHDRIYCGYPCAHCVAVEKSRARCT